MALITQLKEGFKEKESIHNKTECYFIVTGTNNEKYLQIDTYGSEDRIMSGKISQSIQFSPEAIIQLKEILSKIA